ncbi:MAG: hypothetical protein FJW80_10540 [Actinobacteria bacterium]|nr:hypothetical protein [Actinomycetota bacterium]
MAKSRYAVGASVVGLASAVALGVMASLLSGPAQAASLVGTPCQKVGMTMGDGPGRTVVCTRIKKGKNKGKLLWQLSSGPAPSPSPSTSPGPGPSPSPPESCKQRPVFTRDGLALDHVQVVVPIGQQTAFGGSLSIRSYVHTKPELHGQRLPIYAPTDLVLYQASYYRAPGASADYKPEYSLYFDAGCGIEVQVYHVKGVVGAVAGVVPSEPSPSSAGQPVARTPVKAGTQIGWFEGEAGKSVAFDFRVEDSAHTNSFINQQRFDNSPGARGELHAICPYDLYVGAQRDRWLAKLGAPSSNPVPGTPCGVISQGKAGSAQGLWFFRDAKVNEFTYRGDTWSEGLPAGQYQSQIAFTVDPVGTVRIGGLNAVRPMSQLMIPRTGIGSQTWRDPLSVTAGQEYCWSDGTRTAKVRLSADGASLTAVTGTGACADLDIARGYTYVR